MKRPWIVFLATVLLLFGVCGAGYADTITTISTTFADDNGHSGNMFNVSNISAQNVTLTGAFAGNFETGATGTVEIWYRIGGYEGYEYNASAWTLLGSDTYNSVGTGLETWYDVGNSLTIAAGQEIGLYMYTYDYGEVNYTDGANTFSDSFLSIVTGIGLTNTKFGGSIFSPRTWNGTIEYSYGDPVPEPATMLLLGSGIVALAGFRRKKK